MAIYISRGQSGSDVEDLQRKLAILGFKVSIDGIFGPETEKAVKDFQYTWGLKADGIVGPETSTAIDQAISLYYQGMWNPSIDPMQYPGEVTTRPILTIPTKLPSVKAQVGSDLSLLVIAALGAILVIGLLGSKARR